MIKGNRSQTKSRCLALFVVDGVQYLPRLRWSLLCYAPCFATQGQQEQRQQQSAKKDKDPMTQSGGKAKKNWSKGKVWFYLTKSTDDKFFREVPKYKLLTPAVVSEKLKSCGFLTKEAPQELLSKGLTKMVSKH